MRRAIACLVVLFAVLFVKPLPEAVAVGPTNPAHAYAYDSHHRSAATTYTTTERGSPPTVHCRLGTHNTAVDRSSRGASARPDVVRLLTETTYNQPSAFGRGARPTGTTTETARRIDGELRGLPCASVAAKTAGGLSDDLARLANKHVTGSGDTVLGSYPGYISKANSKGASYFDIGDDWNKLVARGQDPWALNQHFLDGRIAAGDRILLSVPKGDIAPGTYLAREVQHLTSNGYKWTNQWSLGPGG